MDPEFDYIENFIRQFGATRLLVAKTSTPGGPKGLPAFPELRPGLTVQW